MKKETRKNKFSGFYFLITVIVIYVILFFLNPDEFNKSLLASWKIFKMVIILISFVIFLSALINYFLNPMKIAKNLSKEAGFKGWLISAVGGIISHGPPYVWYPLIKNIQDKGMNQSFSAVFLYTRAVKIPLLPMMIVFFGWHFTIIFNLMIIISSIFIWKIMERI
jgi:uncharacterized membrane protein YraQ (UPF0718 family)